jgi:hypothetical protein
MSRAGHTFFFQPDVLALYRKRAGNMRSDEVRMRLNKVRVLKRMQKYSTWEQLGGKRQHRNRICVAHRRLATSLRADGRSGARWHDALASCGAWVNGGGRK